MPESLGRHILLAGPLCCGRRHDDSRRAVRLLDGPVARLQNRVSIFGGFLDSILDRYADLILFLGLLVYYASVNRFIYAFLAGAAMAGAVMVSYAKARAESLVPNEDVGFWDRPERLVLMILGALANRMPPVLWILAIGPNITVIHRIVHTWKQTKEVAPPSDIISEPVPSPLQANLGRESAPRHTFFHALQDAGGNHAEAARNHRGARDLRGNRPSLAIAQRNQILARRVH